METNTITHNLMSFSGFKALLIFSMLTESPKTYEEIKQTIENNEYLKETVSTDTIRIYMNSLRLSGCEIKKIKKNKTVRYYIDSNPFELKITDEQIRSIIKVYKAIAKSIGIEDFLTLQQFFNKICTHITNENLKDKLQNISPVSNINHELIQNLIKYTKIKAKIKVLYFSKLLGEEEISIITDKLNITNGKLYLYGLSSKYNNYSSFLVSDIRKVISVDAKPSEETLPEINVKYEYMKSDNTEFERLDNERIIEETNDKILVSITSNNKFIITQRILSLTNRCKVISPENYKNEIIECLKKMKESYIES